MSKKKSPINMKKVLKGVEQLLWGSERPEDRCVKHPILGLSHKSDEDKEFCRKQKEEKKQRKAENRASEYKTSEKIKTKREIRTLRKEKRK